jgi:hypothetical protein
MMIEATGNAINPDWLMLDNFSLENSGLLSA